MYCNRVIFFYICCCPLLIFGQLSGCPEVKITDVNQQDTIYINCNSEDGCVDLVATYPETGTPTNYTVEAIEYAPEFPFMGLAHPISVNTDDVWSDPKVILPFNFCFYNQEYSEAVVSSNGAISFDTSTINNNGYNDPADECAWEFNLSIPNGQFPSTAEPKKILNAIYGVFHDIDPSEGGQIGWELFGDYPCRRLVVSYYQVPLFDCIEVNSTFQMVLYESTNIIEVYIEKKSTCEDWNNGNSVLGIQNANGSEGLTPSGRNTGEWTTENEAWRFVPSGPSNTEITWYDDATGAIIATSQNQISVCPTTAHTYRAEVVYTLCDGNTITSSDMTTVEFTDTVFSDPPIEHVVCDDDGTSDGVTEIDLTVFNAELITELNSSNTSQITYHYSEQDAIDNSNPILPATGFINTANPEIVFGRIEDMSLNCVLIKEIDISITTGPDFFDANITTAAFSDTHNILATATGSSTYLFSINGGAYQTEGLFEDVGSGLHIIRITDIEHCFVELIELVVLSYPKFFTPNGDGINDVWTIPNMEELAYVHITIFDRYGKEIIQLDEHHKGWDGTYNGSPLPASDYWFKLVYTEKAPKGRHREFLSHFSLKR
ncbi:MAG: T9SS type B sorting domain-containing protein [Flavobacteriaceae bacterium]